MRNIHLILVGVLATLLLVGCSGEPNPKTVVGKKALLQQKKQELLALNQEISALEEEIRAEDPTSVREERVVPVATSQLEARTFEHYLEVQGQVASDNSVMVSPQTGGRILRVTVEEGDRVNRGQLLAQIDDAIIRRNIQEVETQLELATIMFEKQKNLWEKEIGTEVQFLTAKNQKESLERRLETLREQQALSLVRAPISGTVDQLMSRTGETVGAGQPILMLVNNQDLSLKAEVSETYAPYIRRGDQVKVTFSILDRSFEAKVKRVGETINPTNRTFTVEVDLPRSRDLKPNMYGQIAINDRTMEDAITVPQSLIQKSDDGEFVYVVEEQGGKWFARRRVIRTGLAYDGKVEVTDGLTAGQRLVVTGYTTLSDGQQVQMTDDTVAEK